MLQRTYSEASFLKENVDIAPSRKHRFVTLFCIALTKAQNSTLLTLGGLYAGHHAWKWKMVSWRLGAHAKTQI